MISNGHKKSLSFCAQFVAVVSMETLFAILKIMKVLFIHRSVGHHLLAQGKLRELLSREKIVLDDYDNNSGILTYSDGRTLRDAITMPGNNTNPNNLAEFFSEWPEVLNGYDLIMVKSCYPNSHIKNETQLSEIKENYTSIIKSFAGRNIQLLILTSPPLRPLFTSTRESQLSSELAHWLVSLDWAGVQVFDFHHALSEITGKHEGMLKREYRRLLPFDNHPNKKSHQDIAPKLAEIIGKTRN